MPRKKESTAEKLIGDAKAAAIDIELMASKSEAMQWKGKYHDAMAVASAYSKRLSLLGQLPRAPEPRAWDSSGKARQKGSDGVAMVVPACDWHVDERIEPEKVNYLNDFGIAIAEERIRRYYEKIIKLIDWQNHLAKVSQLWHPWIGDLMSGHIHEELMETNTMSPVEACSFLQDMLCSGVDFLLKKTRLPIFIPTCVGNHGRTTAKKRVKSSVENSFEWLLYTNISKYYRSKSRVQFMIGTGYHNIQEIMGRTVRFHHGDDMRYQGGVGGISIPVNKAVAAWNRGTTVDFDIFGHWHTHLVNYHNWVSCGCLIGYSEFALKIKADFQHPTQLVAVIDKRYGLTMAEPIFVTRAKGE